MKLVSINGLPLPELESCPLSGELTAVPDADVDVIELLEELLGHAQTGRLQAFGMVSVLEDGNLLQTEHVGHPEHHMMLLAGTVRLQKLLSDAVSGD